jgi:hypothetical protein
LFPSSFGINGVLPSYTETPSYTDPIKPYGDLLYWIFETSKPGGNILLYSFNYFFSLAYFISSLIDSNYLLTPSNYYLTYS